MTSPAALARPAPPPAADVPVLPLAPPQRARVVNLLARAFEDDPIVVHFFRDPARRVPGVETAFRTFLRLADLHGAVDTNPGADGAAIWMRPGHYPVSMAAMLRAGFARWPLALGAGAFRRAVEVMDWMDALHERDQPEEHWYFWVLGVDPALHHRGLGTRLVRHGLARADAQGLPSYCETFRPRMVPYLRRFGYEVLREARAPGGGPTMWTLRRPPGELAKPQGGDGP